MLPAALPFAAAQWLGARRGIALCLLVLCSLQLRFTYTLLQDNNMGFGWLAFTVRSPVSISYYNDAVAIGQDPQWLSDYPQILPLTSLHTRSKPPGPVAYYMAWIKLIGYGNRSAILAGLTLILLESLVVLLVYFFVRSLTENDEAAFAAASFYSLCAGAVFMAPMLDPLYAGFTCLILWSWNRALGTSHLAMALTSGVVLAAGSFCSYAVTLLAPFAAIGALLISRPPRPFVRLPRLLLAAAAGFVAFYAAVWLFTSFNPIATFHSAWNNQHKLLSEHVSERRYPDTILFDLTDFALAMGWVGAVIAMLGISRAAYRSSNPRLRWLLVACAIQPVAVAVLGLLQSETLRVWNFMLPLMAAAGSVELINWTPRARAIAYAAMFTVMLAMGQNLQI